jgi:hypothetical protein
MSGRLLIFSCFFVSMSMAQSPVQHRFYAENNGKSSVGFSSGINMTTADFSNKFIKNLLLDKELDRGVLSREIDRLDESKNRIGIDYEIALKGSWNIKSTAHNIIFSVSDGAHFHGSFPMEAVDLMFSGNKKFAGDTVDVSGLNVTGIRFQQMGAGWAYQPGLNTSIYGLVSIVNGEQLIQADVNRAKLYTSTLGDTLHLNVVGGYKQSDTGNVGFARGNGLGLGLNFGLQAPFQAIGSTQWMLSMDVFNLGFIQWNKKTIQFDIDTVVTWTGVEIPDLDHIDEQFADNQLADSLLEGVNSAFKKTRLNQWLPGSAVFDIMQKKDHGFVLGLGTVVRWKADFNPFGYVKAGYAFSEHIGLQSQIGYGGYGHLQVGLDASLRWESMHFNIYLRNIEAMAVFGNYAGGSAGLTFKYLFQ